MDEVAAKYVEFTKAYKSCALFGLSHPVYPNVLFRLTDETIRKNLEDFGHPDGRQEMSMGIAIPKPLVEGSTGMYFLLSYSLLLGGSLPFIVVRFSYQISLPLHLLLPRVDGGSAPAHIPKMVSMPNLQKHSSNGSEKTVEAKILLRLSLPRGSTRHSAIKSRSVKLS
jgi:hypothetical protein